MPVGTNIQKEYGKALLSLNSVNFLVFYIQVGLILKRLLPYSVYSCFTPPISGGLDSSIIGSSCVQGFLFVCLFDWAAVVCRVFYLFVCWVNTRPQGLAQELAQGSR